MNLPNRLTMLRIFLIPLFIACFYLPWSFKWLLADIVFILAYITDALDGRIARKNNMVTDFGKFMDPIADKLLTAAAIIFMNSAGFFNEYIGVAFVFITVAREFIVSGLRLVAASKGVVIAADKLGKLKTVFQFVTVAVIMIDGYVLKGSFAIVKTVLDNMLIGVTLILTIWSMIDYLIKNKSVFAQTK